MDDKEFMINHKFVGRLDAGPRFFRVRGFRIGPQEFLEVLREQRIAVMDQEPLAGEDAILCVGDGLLDAFRIRLNCPTCPKLTKIAGKGLGAEFPVFVTLPAAESYRFEIEGDTFTSLVIPEVLSGMDSFSLTFDGSEVLFPITVGEVFDLTTIDPGGLASLIIMGMDPGSDMDRYVFGAAFLSGAEETVLSMTGTGIVPEPATGIMLMLGLGMAAMLFRRDVVVS